MPELSRKRNVIILCSRWYMKKNLIFIMDEYPNLDLIGNTRSDSVIYNLPSHQPGKRADQQNTDATCQWKRIASFLARMPTITVQASTLSRQISSEQGMSWHMWPVPAVNGKVTLNHTGSNWIQYISLFPYSFRWNIEVSYTMNTNFSGHCVSTYCAATQGFKCWSTLSTLVTVSWSYCHIQRRHFRNTGTAA